MGLARDAARRADRNFVTVLAERAAGFAVLAQLLALYQLVNPLPTASGQVFPGIPG